MLLLSRERGESGVAAESAESLERVVSAAISVEPRA